MSANHWTCPTCAAPVPQASVEWEDVVAERATYCSIHCEHYAGLARAAVEARAA